MSASFAIFLSSVAFFDLSRGVMYCGSKLFSISIPILLFGRSRKCPKDDSTLYPLPRNFEMVFALVGDSTITSVFIEEFYVLVVCFFLYVLWRAVLFERISSSDIQCVLSSPARKKEPVMMSVSSPFILCKSFCIAR